MRGGWRGVCASDTVSNAVDCSEPAAVGHADPNADVIANQAADIAPLAVAHGTAQRRAIADSDLCTELLSYGRTLDGAKLRAVAATEFDPFLGAFERTKFASILFDAYVSAAGGADASPLAASDVVSFIPAFERAVAAADVNTHIVAVAAAVGRADNDANRASVRELCSWHLDLSTIIVG